MTPLRIKVVGTQYRPQTDRDFAETLDGGELVYLEREPSNPHDGNAVKVLARDEIEFEYHIGYIERPVAAHLAPWLKQRGDRVEASIEQRLPGGNGFLLINPMHVHD